MKEKPPYYHETRRLLLRFGLFALLRTLFVSWINETGSEERKREIIADVIRQGREVAQAFEKSAPLQVWHFSQNLITTAIKLAEYHRYQASIGMPLGWFIGDSLLGYLLEKYSELVNRGAGVSAMFVGRSIDIISTHYTGTVYQDPRMQEYKLDTYFGEANQILARNHTADDVIDKAPVLLLPPIAASAFFPSLGRGYLGASPAIAATNLAIAKTAILAMEIGDEVKQLIRTGKDETFIREYIETFGNNISTQGVE